jgi:hypothetical protein
MQLQALPPVLLQLHQLACMLVHCPGCTYALRRSELTAWQAARITLHCAADAQMCQGTCNAIVHAPARPKRCICSVCDSDWWYCAGHLGWTVSVQLGPREDAVDAAVCAHATGAIAIGQLVAYPTTRRICLLRLQQTRVDEG